jgi:hypothetical protein
MGELLARVAQPGDEARWIEAAESRTVRQMKGLVEAAVDAPGNIASVCTWCHLCGVHGGRIRALGPAERIRWELGVPGHPCVVVNGRERVAA